ncbi:PA14 domain-containing protein [Portibacter marinus]|uniref:PA14 domain-containing protein n=1 Tax=Portibacter marinus TaxID=2898660 RepID=UPI001F180D5F|nr:PA14 domain-containing protein [Portibacter marinus]
MRTIIFLLSVISGIYVNGQICVGTAGQLEWQAWEGLFDGQFSELSADPDFPGNPDVVQNIFRLKSPSNYNDYYGTRVEGFISVPQNTTATFNVTGDHYVQFYLSSNENPANKQLIARVYEPVSELEHNTYPEQTSAPVNLIAGEYYYFEVLLVDRWGSDRFSIWWQTDLVSSTQWNVVTAAYLFGVGCKDEPCPELGTPCDDGDNNTSDDVEDGHCNCFGKPSTSDVCVGERGALTAYRYDGIPGGSLNDLYEAPHFPGMPTTSESCSIFGREDTNDFNDIGFAMQAYLTVPVSGLYKFNVTGDDNTILFISSDHNPENRQAHQMLVSGWTNMTEHDKYIYQSTSFIYLERGQYYYIEINQKDGGGGEHFSAFWQTPFTDLGVWKRIPAIYFFDYNCEVACIPQGTICDDGDPFTNDDTYNDSCECQGIPCSGPDCDSPLANYIPKEKCAPSSSLDNNERSSWISCARTANPNSSRGNGHWIMYDLGNRHELHQTQIWNYNKAGETEKGMTSVAIDYSEDGQQWTEFGTYNWALAPGSDGYGGFTGPDFQGIYANYVLITSLDAGSACKGIGKVAFTTVNCPQAGTLCNDGDPLSFNDKYDNNCECKGSAFDVNDCGELQVLLGDTLIGTNKFSAIENVQSISDVAANSRVSFVGGKSIILEPGFETTGQTYFLASIDPCETPEVQALMVSRADAILANRAQREKDRIEGLAVRNLEDDIIEVSYFVKEPGRASLEIYDNSGHKLFTLMNHEFTNQGLYRKLFRSKKLAKGELFVRFNRGEEVLEKSYLMQP